MVKLPILACLICLSANASVALDETEIFFKEHINKVSVENFIKLADVYPNLKTIILNSGGGDVVAGMDLGDYIYARGLDVIVDGVCTSSCANYLFISGRKKTLRYGSIVGWHGSPDGDFKNIRFKCGADGQCSIKDFFALFDKVKFDGDVFPYEKDQIIRNMKRHFYEGQINIGIRNDDFFKRRNVDVSITRYGFCKLRSKEFWTYPIEDMRKFGVKDIFADEGDYLKSASGSSLVDVFYFPENKEELNCL